MWPVAEFRSANADRGNAAAQWTTVADTTVTQNGETLMAA
jgi:hypothetical protein